MPTLLQINSVANIGSTGRIAEQIGNKVIEQGWKSIIAYGRDASTSNSSLIRIGNYYDIYSHVLGSKLFDSQGLMSKEATARFLRQVNDIKPDIIQIHNLHGYYINYPMLMEYIKAHKIPTVITLHDFWLMTGHCAYINDSCDKWLNNCNKCPRRESYPSTLIDNASRNLSIKKSVFEDLGEITIVPVSYWLQRKIQHSILKNLKSTVIQNGIDISQFYPDNTSSVFNDESSFKLLCIATKWTESNGYSQILELAEKTDKDVEIVIVGVDKKQKEELPQNVVGIERTENIDHLRKLYSQSNLFLNPNKEVTFGLVTAESMACGTPSIVFRNTAGEEIINDLGYVIDDIQEVNDIINKVRHMNKTMPERQVNHIRENFDVDKQLDKYMSLYTQMI